MLVIRGQALRYGARAAEPLKPRHDLGVIQVGMITAVGADELIHAAAAIVAAHAAGRLDPQERSAAVARLTGERHRAGGVGPAAGAGDQAGCTRGLDELSRMSMFWM